MVGEGYREGVFVTTATAFSEGASAYADRIHRAYAPINLIPAGRFQELIRDVVAKRARLMTPSGPNGPRKGLVMAGITDGALKTFAGD
jgi:hypothetical protein